MGFIQILQGIVPYKQFSFSYLSIQKEVALANRLGITRVLLCLSNRGDPDFYNHLIVFTHDNYNQRFLESELDFLQLVISQNYY